MTEFDSFFKEQPSICDFITELTSESSLRIQELSLFLSYMVFKTVKLGQPDTLPPSRRKASKRPTERAKPGSTASIRKETMHRFRQIPSRI